MAHLSGKTGNVYANSLVVEDCEDAWNEGGEDAGSTPSTTAGKVGTNAARSTTVTVGASALLMSEVISVDLTTYDAMVFWFRSSLTFSAGDMALLIDDTANCASPIEVLSFPTYGTANVFQRVLIRLATPASLGSIISIGLRQVTDLADGTFDIDDVRAVQIVDGAKDWTVDYTGDTAEVTDYQSLGTKEYVAGPTGWTASFESVKDGIPLGFNTEVVLGFEEGGTVGNSWIGNGIINGLSPSAPIDGVVAYSYTVIGASELEAAVS